MNALTSKQTTSTPVVAPSFVKILEEGYGDEMIRALIDSIEYYVGYLALANMGIGECDSINIHILTRMLRALLKDQHSIDNIYTSY